MAESEWQSINAPVSMRESPHPDSNVTTESDVQGVRGFFQRVLICPE
jgi:hypothetical protein